MGECRRMDKGELIDKGRRENCQRSTREREDYEGEGGIREKLQGELPKPYE